MKELNTIQTSLKVPKGREVKNSNGKVMYCYRSCEDILEAIKESLTQTNCTITITDDVVMMGNRFYIKATATITNESGESISTSALAREPESLGSMTQPQVTGCASSYARKYALSGLLALDDTTDIDGVDIESDEKAEIEQIVKPMAVQTNSIAELKKLYDSYPQYRGKPEYVAIFTERRYQLEHQSSH